MITFSRDSKENKTDTIRLMRKTLFIIPMALFLSACTNGPSDPLFDAPLGQRTVCTAVNPIGGNDVLSVVPFNCPDIEISTTLNELRDAGWRLESVHMGEEIRLNDTFSSDVSITVRKAY